jgi:hypothetical protein
MPLPIHRSTCEPPGAEKDPATHRPADDREWLERHVARHGIKPEPNQCDPVDSVYDIGENSDCSVDAMFSDNVRDLIDPFARIPHAKASFATKLVNRDLLAYEPRGGTRVRFSLMPEETSRLVDVRTSKVGDRIAALDHFVEAGYTVAWKARWVQLLSDVIAERLPSCRLRYAF